MDPRQEQEKAIVSAATLSIGIHGACGRMGKRLIQLLAEDAELKLAAALERDGHPDLGKDAGAMAGVYPLGVAIASSAPADLLLDAMIDFSQPGAAIEVARLCSQRGVPLVVGTTGFDLAERKALEASSREIALLISPNMSRAVNLLMRLVREAARSLGRGCDIAIVERHHRTKKDAPSGTALQLGEFADQGRSSDAHPREAQVGRREQNSGSEISFHSLRMADSPGEHTVVFGLPGETLELTHRAINRDGFARGALDAAKFLAGKPPGLYSIEDMLAENL
jgi:4-hydroxy-tetrahydrodipicolinate reductase